MDFADAVSLHGREVSLVPLSHGHHDDLIEALNDGELWSLWYTSIPTPDQLDGEIRRRLALHQRGAMVPFTVIEKSSNQAVGMTTFMNIDAANRRLEIGATWYRKRVQRSAVNTECKFLLLSYAFEQLKCIAVEFRTHFFNRQSRAGIERLGAKLDGVLRQHQLGRDGTLRDTCVYSIVDGEWPTVKAHLSYQLERQR
ncbi:MAG TPA: GNAT family protein [Steroidobacteraceae bacterium]|jgi:RimJ/RimL family protein N-acetyltransferase|nr:GNAT family protein [Steroidobacteraceae bacterium]